MANKNERTVVVQRNTAVPAEAEKKISDRIIISPVRLQNAATIPGADIQIAQTVFEGTTGKKEALAWKALHAKIAETARGQLVDAMQLPHAVETTKSWINRSFGKIDVATKGVTTGESDRCSEKDRNLWPVSWSCYRVKHFMNKHAMKMMYMQLKLPLIQLLHQLYLLAKLPASQHTCATAATTAQNTKEKAGKTKKTQRKKPVQARELTEEEIEAETHKAEVFAWHDAILDKWNEELPKIECTQNREPLSFHCNSCNMQDMSISQMFFS